MAQYYYLRYGINRSSELTRVFKQAGLRPPQVKHKQLDKQRWEVSVILGKKVIAREIDISREKAELAVVRTARATVVREQEQQ